MRQRSRERTIRSRSRRACPEEKTLRRAQRQFPKPKIALHSQVHRLALPEYNRRLKNSFCWKESLAHAVFPALPLGRQTPLPCTESTAAHISDQLKSAKVRQTILSAPQFLQTGLSASRSHILKRSPRYSWRLMGSLMRKSFVPWRATRPAKIR